MDLRQQLDEAVSAIRDESEVRPRIGIILGSGLGPLASEVTSARALPYDRIPHFPVSTTAGHSGKLVLGELEGLPVAVMAGRVHLYEGYSAQQIAFPVRVLQQLGAEALLITNAAGGVNIAFTAGTLMVISDQINSTGRSPLVGVNDEQVGPRFPDMSEAYSLELRQLARRAADRAGVPLAEGVYMGLLGPQFETPAEIRMARALGADAVGMSTVMEVIAANHCGLPVLGISCITNLGAGILPQKLSAQEVYDTADRVREQFSLLVRSILGEYASL